MLTITIRENQIIKIGDAKVFIRKSDKNGKGLGRQWRLYIDAGKDIIVKRTDILAEVLK